MGLCHAKFGSIYSGTGVVGLLLALFVAVGIKRLPPGTVAMQEHLSHIKI